MKNFWGFLLMLIIGFAACEGPAGKDGTDGRDGRDGIDGRDGRNGRDGRDGKDGRDGNDGHDGKDGDGSHSFIIKEFFVHENSWIPDYDVLMDNFFFYGFEINELTPRIYNNGAVVCYLVQEFDFGVVQTPLPYTFYGSEDNGTYFYSENYTYEISPGHITFIVKISDFNTEAQQPLSCNFRVVLLW